MLLPSQKKRRYLRMLLIAQADRKVGEKGREKKNNVGCWTCHFSLAFWVYTIFVTVTVKCIEGIQAIYLVTATGIL